MTAPCKHKMAWGQIQLVCVKDAHPDDPEHAGILEQTLVTWFDGDRRDYTGQLVECPWRGCLLPGGHHGDHAV